MSTLTLVIGNKNYSSWSLRPWILMKHYGIDFNEIRVPLFEKSTKKNLASYNSDYKVPVLIDNDLQIWDSLSIMEYLSEKYLDHGGWPKNQTARAMARSMSNEMHSSYANIRKELPMNCRKKFTSVIPSKDAQLEIQRVTYLWDQMRSDYGDNGDWLFGRYSIADAMFAPLALRFHGYNVELDTISKAYVNSVVAHPKVVEWIEAGKLESEVIQEDEVYSDLARE